ncbi:hypothetical protein [Ferrimicrobium sp.]|uniref:hypothetical protein n=1 Tax=Ferrimicrobium sp. TaxID=2926050 RepID=UPI00260BB43C|nr:hypothetical protein [Ferrimicrobium sp.]
MVKVVIHLFHGDPDSLSAGSHVAERIRQVAGEQGAELEVYCFGPAQDALIAIDGDPVKAAYNTQIDELIAAGVPVGACLNAAQAAGAEQTLSDRGINLQYARDAFVRFVLEGATVIGF